MTSDVKKTLVKKRYLGEGTYGIIIGNPRLPTETENLEDINYTQSTINQVSKAIKDNSNIKKIIWIIDLINQRFNPDNLSKLQTQIVIPSRPQLINWQALELIPDEILFLKKHKITKRRYKWQYIMERGTTDLETELNNIHTLNQLKNYLKNFANIIDGIASLHSTGLVHTDIKLTNMIVSWTGQYKIIDLDELGDATRIPTYKPLFEKIYHNTYYPYYTLAGAFLWLFTHQPSKIWDDNTVNLIKTYLIKKNYNKEYYKYFKDIIGPALKIANDPQLTQIIQLPYETDADMDNYLIDFMKRINTLSDPIIAHRELLLFNDRYALGINLFILLTKYYKLTGQIKHTTSSSINNTPDKTDSNPVDPGHPGALDNTLNSNKCEFIPQSLIAIIKLCCCPTNYSVINTDFISSEYRNFINQLFTRYPFKFIIKLLSDFVIHRKTSSV